MRKAARLPVEQLEPYIWRTEADGAEPSPTIEWKQLFGNDHPVEVEVGFGKGLFLVRASGEHPEINYFGVEIEKKYFLYTATRLAKRQRENVRVAHGDAKAILRDRIPRETVQAVHVYFPDPWWKKRHHKRRLFTEDFVEECERALLPGGYFHIATDVGDYFEVMQDLISHRNGLQKLPRPVERDPSHDMDYLTNFERKARQQGKPIYRALYQKKQR